ncbi:threonine--tRNA ligase [Marine Group I thaumarchaeote]|uniref:Threonine--tRNA ligase n=1 Tax=Marine Group I thaumarchaeote TaxID=2511932 RepID=A0A7K4MJN1_9ARCH|nr:threonine--tRNA ligase [Candidatus Nitrosopumilus sp. MTA1]NWJ20628.1 threonine--tRNA ligase [Marine Group I thaumarchaeote]NWJ28782.1 threonine--tRNA ligase [Marine Group I thaumarchaeote]NWJ57228.1 threonine--tRNA ligase [Marine Group I thaumarchaeote]NWJ83728.1 threonine--tRNA ligase [Marine Group I thaumarchaeote]
MRILQLHCDHIEYTPTKKEIQSAEDIENPETKRFEEIVVAFVAIEDGDDSSVAQNAISQIKNSMEQIGCKKLLLYPYAHLSSNLAKPSIAITLLKEMEENASDLEVSHSPFGWTKSYNVKVKGHPLAESFKVITKNLTDSIDNEEITSEALEGESKILSYWKIMSPDGTMINIGDFDFSNHKKLEILAKYESIKQRRVDEPSPHVALMKKMTIADYEPASDSGNLRFYPNGRLIKSLIESYVTDKVKEYGGYEVETPIMYDSEHPSMISYFNRFPARQYNIDSDGKKLFLRFAACFGQFLMANQYQLSYKNLPFKLYELTRYSFRREQSGELVGLRRLRAFTMPDCHAFCKDMDQAIDEIKIRFDLSQSVLHELGIDESDYEMAIRFTEDFYNENKSAIEELVKKHGKPVLVEMWKDKFFYFVLKWEFNFIDNLGKASALSTDQIDVENADRYGIEFVDENNNKQHPIILHNSPSGAIERIIYVLLEKAAKDIKEGRKPQYPLWLAPTQVRVIPLKEEFNDFCETLTDKISSNNIRVDIDDRNESIGKRIREAEKEWIRYILVIGEKEVNSENLSIRDRQTGDVKELPFDDFLKEINEQTKGKPFTGLNLSKHLSKRPPLMV